MKTLQLFIFFLLCLFPLSGEEKHPLKMTYVYEKDMEGKNSQTTWIVEEKNKNLHIQGISKGGETLIITTPPLNTQSFSYQSKNHKNEYYIYRNGSYLLAKKVDNGQLTQKEFNIGNKFWVQDFDFSMRPFILSTADSLTFYIVHPNHLSLHQMIATKSSTPDSMHINGKEYDAIKVKITLTGLKKMFWKADLWFDRTTGDLIKYVANEGPNTPVSIITLFSKSLEKCTE